MRALICAFTLAVAACASPPAFDPAVPLVLTGEITRADHQTYREIPFTVPAGAHSLTVEFTYDNANRTVIDLGLRDPTGQRGWSGGNKSTFTVGNATATPSYRPGALQPGEWKLILGVPNIREGQTASYKATVLFSDVPLEIATFDQATPTVLTASPGWYRGDFHVHTEHSDGSCGPEGDRSPCPTAHTADAARDTSLDFVAITDHNTITQLADINRLQLAYPKTLLIPGTEITTFHGHANVVGNRDFLDFQLGSPRLPTLAKLFDQVDAANAFISVNHPSLPSGEVCMGCGWTVKDTDWSRVAAIEVVNGSTLRTSGAEGGFSGIAFWDKLLKEGHHITAIGGSDNHDATDVTGAKQSPVGKPTTVVYAKSLSAAEIVAAVKSGRVFVDVAGLPDAVIDLAATAGKQSALMGGEIKLGKDEEAAVSLTARNLPADAELEIVGQGLNTAQAGNLAYRVSLAEGAAFGWIRFDIRDASGKLLLLGNPIYFVRAAGP